MKPSAVLAHFQHIATLGLPPSQSIPELLDLTLALVPGEIASAFAFGPRLAPRAVHAPRIVGMPGEMVNFDWGAVDPRTEPTPDKLVALGGKVNNLARLDMPIEKSLVYNEVSRPMGLAPTGIDLIVRDPLNRPLGVVYVMRKLGSRYTEADERALAALHGYFAMAFAVPEGMDDTATIGDRHDPVAEASGTVIADGQGRVVAASRDALALAVELADIFGATEPIGIGRALPTPLDALFPARAGARDPAMPLPGSASWVLPRGLYRARVEQLAGAMEGLSGGGLSAIALARHPSLEVALLRRVARLDLSPAQRRIAYFVGGGVGNDAIAARLGITAETLRGYLKTIYAQLGCDGRVGLATRLQRD